MYHLKNGFCQTFKKIAFEIIGLFCGAILLLTACDLNKPSDEVATEQQDKEYREFESMISKLKEDEEYMLLIKLKDEKISYERKHFMDVIMDEEEMLPPAMRMLNKIDKPGDVLCRGGFTWSLLKCVKKALKAGKRLYVYMEDDEVVVEEAA